MMGKSYSLFVALLAATVVAAVDPMDVAAVYPDSPVSDTVFMTNAANTISWTNNATDLTASIKTLTLVLGTGTSNQVTELDTIVTGLKFPDTIQYDWTIPAQKYNTSAQYTIVFKGLNAKGVEVSHNWSTWFHIADGNNTAAPSTSAQDTPTQASTTSPTVTSTSSSAASRPASNTATVSASGPSKSSSSSSSSTALRQSLDSVASMTGSLMMMMFMLMA